MVTIDSASLTHIISAVGGLGLASFGLVDATKALPGAGVSNSGFSSIEAAVRLFVVDARRDPNAPDLAGSLLQTLQGNWINGMPSVDQKAVAKSLIKLRLTPVTSAQYAKVTLVDPAALSDAATSMTTGQPLTLAQNNALGRFDLALTAILDAAYHRADQRYRNISKILAGVFAVVLAFVAGGLVEQNWGTYFSSGNWLLALICGVLAVPLAPVSKDLTSALSAGVKMAQAIKR
jgi:hypothetical protein